MKEIMNKAQIHIYGYRKPLIDEISFLAQR